MKQKILIIEDVEEIRQDIIEILDNFDFEVISAENGSVGVELAKQHLPDLIISDILMPGMDGFQVLETLSKNKETVGIPFIFLSAKADISDIRQGMNLGADDYLTKPFSIHELYQAIIVRLDKKEARERIQATFKHREDKFRKLAQQEELLNHLTQQIRNSLEIKTIIKTTLQSLQNLLNLHYCSFSWYQTDVAPAYFEKIEETVQVDEIGIPDFNPLQEASGLGKYVLSEQVFKIDNVFNDDLPDATIKNDLNSVGLVSLLAVRIKTKTGKVGVILCQQFVEPRSWDENEIALLQAVGDQLEIAIEQAELYAKSRFNETTAKLQASQLEQALSQLQQTQSQLIQTEKMSSLGQMVAGIAHEINNPINFIHGNVNHLRSYVEDLVALLQLYQNHTPDPSPEIRAQAESIDLEFILEDIPKLLNSLQIGTDRIREIVLSLRNFSRIDESDFKKADIHEGIDSTLLILQNRLKASGDRAPIQVIKDYGEIPQIDCYPGQLNQVFMNIISNGIDAIEQLNPSSPCLKISTQVTDNNWVKIGIIDNGFGISEDIKNKLFDPFFTTKAVGKGTGLGLSISYQIIVEKHKGTLECISSPGEGTQFWISIPVEQSIESAS